LKACLEECDRHGADAVFLWPTPRSRSLYARHGFAVHEDLMERRRFSQAAPSKSPIGRARRD
jgi:hypothetical protein